LEYQYSKKDHFKFPEKYQRTPFQNQEFLIEYKKSRKLNLKNIKEHSKIKNWKDISIKDEVKNWKDNKKNTIHTEKLLNFLLVEILINNASFNPKQTTLNVNNKLEKFSINKWNEEIDVGLKGAFLCSRIFGNEMVKNKKGVIINIASDLSVISPDNRLYNKGKKINIVKPVSYSVVKSGLIGLTKYISTYWALKNVRCNAISPGGVFDNQNKNFLKKIKKVIPLGRMAEKNEYRSAIQFLCSDASSYMNGHNMVIDGGRSVW